MAGSTFKFPLPHRRASKQPKEVRSISSPMTTKVQKVLGNAEININLTSPVASPDPSKTWETRSAVSGVSGISVSISETTASGPACRFGDKSTVSSTTKGQGNAPWDQESDIIPKGLGISGSGTGRSQVLDATTDASSLRRRRSSSTIVSYYDKSKLPLSISQQTSNSAMAKGFPNKAAELLDMECPRPAPSPPKPERKKPSRLDLTHLLPSAATSRLAKLSHKKKGGMVLGPDLLTRSPSVMSTSPAMSSSEFETGPEKKLSRKLTKESLRSFHSSRGERLSSLSAEPKPSQSLRTRATDTGTLHHLYEHYEKTSYRDTMSGHEPEDSTPSAQQSAQDPEPGSRTNLHRDSRHSASTSSPSTNKSRHHASPSFSSVTWSPFTVFSSDKECGTIEEDPLTSAAASSLASPPTEYAASVSSRHTRTSKASKRTEHSFADFDPNATSVLSLSSDSEDDDPEPPRTGASNPSIKSRDSISSTSEYRRPNTSISQESIRSQPKSRFRASLSPQRPFLAIPEHAAGTIPPTPMVHPRQSSLASALTTSSPRPSISTTVSSVRSPSRLSQVSTSTTESVATHFSRPRLSVSSSASKQSPDVRHVALLQSRGSSNEQKYNGPILDRLHESPKARHDVGMQRSQPTPPLSPSSMEFVVRGSHDDTANEHNGPVLTLSSASTAEDERFIAVTKQEEMLLAAMRAKRALMRENLQIAGLEELDRDGERERIAAKKESLSSIKTVKPSSLQPPPIHLRPGHGRSDSTNSNSSRHSRAITSRFPEPPSTKTSFRKAEPVADAGSEEQVLMCLDRRISTMNPHDLAEPSPDLSDFIIDFDADQFPTPPRQSTSAPIQSRPTHSRNTSAASASGKLTHPRPTQHRQKPSVGRPRPDSEFLPNFTPPPALEPVPALPPTCHVDLDAVSLKDDPAGKRPSGPPIDSRRPDSPSSLYEDPDLTQQTETPSRKKAVRISAVGMNLPEMGQWGDDG